MLEEQEARAHAAGKPARRAVHAKQYGCVRGVFTVRGDVPEDARRGLFREAGKSWPALLRFSNGNGTAKPDTEKDLQGLAIKLIGVPGEKLLDDEKDAATQDFVLINHPVFVVATAKRFAELFEALLAGRGTRYFLRGFNPFRWRIHELRIALAMRGKKITDPLSTRYFSAVPSRLGPGAVKYSVRPCALEPETKAPRGAGPQWARRVLARRLSDGAACMSFLIQRQLDAKTMPVEDSTVLWDETVSPFVPVADIRISSQDVLSDAAQPACEDASFTPWHSLPEHRPLGGLMRARREVYRTMSGFRRLKNGVPREEPATAD